MRLICIFQRLLKENKNHSTRPTVADEPNETHTKSYQISKEADSHGINKKQKDKIWNNNNAEMGKRKRERAGPKWVGVGLKMKQSEFKAK